MTTSDEKLLELAKECEAVAAVLSGPVGKAIDAIFKALEPVARSFSGSWFGYHSRSYCEGFKPVPPGRAFNAEWGNSHPSAGYGMNAGFKEVSYEEVHDHVMLTAGDPDEDAINRAANSAEAGFPARKQRLVSILSILKRQDTGDDVIADLLKRTCEVQIRSEGALASDDPPSATMTRDSEAYQEGMVLPHHVLLHARIANRKSAFEATAQLATIARHAVEHLEANQALGGHVQEAAAHNSVFIGHGHSNVWKDLKDFLHDRLRLDWQEFNRESAAGLATTERLAELFAKCNFAFLIFSADDEHADRSLHARENVIHEAGLFQGRLGFKRAIILLERGCEEFSNIHGLGQIRFDKGNVLSASEEIRKVLERESVIADR